MEERPLPSTLAFGFVLLAVGGSVLWWTRHRPAYLLYQAHREIGHENQAAVIEHYRSLLKDGRLSRDEEIKTRRSLGELYLRALQASSGDSLYVRDAVPVDNPFLADAKQEFERVIELDPNDALSHYYLGRLLWLQKLDTFALQEFEKSRQMAPQNPEPLRFLSLVHQERGEAGVGRDLALQALAIDPSDDGARQALISAYGHLGDDQRALAEFERLSPAYRSQPGVRADHALALARQNEWRRAAAEIDAAVRADPTDADVRIAYGRLLLERWSFDEAAGQFEQAASLAPKNLWPVVWQTRALSLRGSCDDALHLGQTLSEGWPRWGWARLANGWANECAGNDAIADAEYSEARRLAPDLVDATRALVRLDLDRGQFDRAGDLIRPLLDRDETKAEGYVWLAESLFRQDRLDLASEAAESAIRANDRRADAFAWLGLIRARRHDRDGAARAFGNAFERNAADPWIAAAEAAAAADLGDVRMAASRMKELLQRAPRSAAVECLAGEVDLAGGDAAQATQAFQSALAIRPFLLDAHLGLIQALAAMGDKVRAGLALADALRVNGRDPRVLAWRRRLKPAA